MGTGVWTPDGVMERSVLWVSQVWQQLNACLSRLGTHEALLGPQLFLSCPVVPNNTQAVVRCVFICVYMWADCPQSVLVIYTSAVLVYIKSKQKHEFDISVSDLLYDALMLSQWIFTLSL